MFGLYSMGRERKGVDSRPIPWDGVYRKEVLCGVEGVKRCAGVSVRVCVNSLIVFLLIWESSRCIRRCS